MKGGDSKALREEKTVAGGGGCVTCNRETRIATRRGLRMKNEGEKLASRGGKTRHRGRLEKGKGIPPRNRIEIEGERKLGREGRNKDEEFSKGSLGKNRPIKKQKSRSERKGAKEKIRDRSCPL